MTSSYIVTPNRYCNARSYFFVPGTRYILEFFRAGKIEGFRMEVKEKVFCDCFFADEEISASYVDLHPRLPL